MKLNLLKGIVSIFIRDFISLIFYVKNIFVVIFLIFIIINIAFPSFANSTPFPFPLIKIGVEKAENPDQIATALEIVALLTILSLAPAILIMMTSFTRLIIVFHFLRQAVGTQQSPPNQVMVGLALFFTFFIMTPVWTQSYEKGLRPYFDEEIDYKKAFYETVAPVKKFMLINTRENDLALFIKAAKISRPKTKKDISLLTLIPAFVISELKTSFIIGFILYVPFLIIDMVVASILLSMGMMMLPPVMISLPFKLILFVLVDGWNILAGSLIKSFNV
jgi:flagellar biosynthetic protein FliP